MLIEAKANANSAPNTAADSAQTNLVLGRFSQTLTGALVPAYYEAVARGLVFAASTPATGVAPGTAVGTTAAYSLFNPSGSGKLLVVIKASMGYISGTLGAGTTWYLANVNPTATATSGIGNTVINCALGTGASTSAQGNVGLSFTTATIPSPTILRPAWSLTALLASTAVQPYVVSEDLGGEFIVKPGCTLSLHSTAAGGSSPIVAFGMTWVELAI